MGKLRHQRGKPGHGSPRRRTALRDQPPPQGPQTTCTGDRATRGGGDPSGDPPPAPAEEMPQRRSPGCFTKSPCPWPVACVSRGQPARYSRHRHVSLSRHRWVAGADPSATVNAQGAEQQLRRAGSPAAPSLCRGIGFSQGVGLHTRPSTRELSFANGDKTRPRQRFPWERHRSTLRQPLATIPSRAGAGRAQGRLAQADHRRLRLLRRRFCLKLGLDVQN